MSTNEMQAQAIAQIIAEMPLGIITQRALLEALGRAYQAGYNDAVANVAVTLEGNTQ